MIVGINSGWCPNGCVAGRPLVGARFLGRHARFFDRGVTIQQQPHYCVSIPRIKSPNKITIGKGSSAPITAPAIPLRNGKPMAEPNEDPATRTRNAITEKLSWSALSKNGGGLMIATAIINDPNAMAIEAISKKNVQSG